MITQTQQTARQYAIGTVSEMTGVNAVTLRAWERRYGLIRPVRTPKGHRLYSEQDVDLINRILERMDSGLSVSEIALEILHSDAEQVGDTGGVWQGYTRGMIEAIEHFDEHQLDAVYNEVMSLYPVDIVTSKLIEPMLELLGERWENGQGSVAEEHFFSVYMRNKLGTRFHHQNLQNRGPKIVAACLPGEHHEFGLLLFALNAHSRGYRVVLLGADMPMEELPIVAERAGCHAIVLSGSISLDCAGLEHDIARLTTAVDVPVFLGGGVSKKCDQAIEQAGAVLLGTRFSFGINTITETLNQKRQ